MIKIFITTFNQMLVLFSLILVGFLLNKKNLLSKNTWDILSKLEIYFFIPALIYNVFSIKCTVQVLREKSVYFIYGAIILIFTYIIAILLSKLFAKDKILRNIYTYSFTISNIGFIGYAVVNAVFGEDMLFNMIIFCLPFDIFVYTIGMTLLIPSQNKISLKTFINPIFIAMFLGALVGLLSVPVPQFINNAVSSASDCMVPIAMIMTGFIIANYNFKELVSNIKIYCASILRLVIIPTAVILILKAIGTQSNIVIIALSSLAMPLGLHTIIFPAAYGGDTSTGASMALVSSALAVITIPIMFMIFIV